MRGRELGIGDYFDKLDAPVKGLYTFEESAHSPVFEEPEKMLDVLREISNRATIASTTRSTLPGAVSTKLLGSNSSASIIMGPSAPVTMS